MTSLAQGILVLIVDGTADDAERKAGGEAQEDDDIPFQSLIRILPFIAMSFSIQIPVPWKSPGLEMAQPGAAVLQNCHFVGAVCYPPVWP